MSIFTDGILLVVKPILRKMVGDKVTPKQMNIALHKLIDIYITEENITIAGDKVIDLLENLAAKTKTTIDDDLVALIRKASKIPDNDKPK